MIVMGACPHDDHAQSSNWGIFNQHIWGDYNQHSQFGYQTITVERPQRGEDGKIVLGQRGKAKGKPVPDSSLRDTENVPLDEDIHTYFKREVLPHAPDAWIDEDKTKIGYEIPFNRYFYVFEPPRPLEEIDADLKEVTAKIMAMLGELSA
ncbi:N-6 DNA methylase [Gluconacetobacter sp. SXCC-1]|nr:N-6 DNA methylase [Gluconacetobacter sp. SXCC-1]